MPDDSHPLKRQRTDDFEASSSLEDSTRSTIWFEDGNVILNAENTLFRVHRSILSLHSSVFEDLLGSLSSKIQIEGCPVLTVQDSAEDMTHFLKALTDRSYYREKDIQSITITSSILRLSKKYHVDHLADDASSRLGSDFPASLRLYDRTATASRIIRNPGWIIDALNIAREVGLVSVLPACFVAIFRYSLYDVFNGKVRDDGSSATLSAEDQMLFVTGSDKLRTAIAKEMFSWLDIAQAAVKSCQRGCWDARFKLAIVFWKPSGKSSRILKKWQSSFAEGLCTTCSLNAKEEYEAGRSRIWERLPSFFGLPEWKDMQMQ